MTGLYIHVPFCVKKCHYCNFVITGLGPVAKHDLFLSSLEKEIKHTRHRFSETAFDTLYVGGGTPSALTHDETRRFFDLIYANFRFKEGAEITYETNPGDADESKAEAYKESRISRISLGAQSFHDKTLRRINRAHGVRDIYASYDILRKAGFKNINMDLILSLPGESLEELKVSLGELARLSPEHVSLYELTIEEKTVFGSQFKEGKLALPPEEESLAMLSHARQFLKERGFGHYELLNYAKPGFESRHNRLYWANEEYLGLGPGAFSYFDGRRFRNSASYEEYLAKIHRDDWTAREEETLTFEKKEIESFLLALRLSEGADVRRFVSILTKLQETISGLQEKGLLEKEANKIRLTPRGQFFAETVFSELSVPEGSDPGLTPKAIS